MNAKTARRFLDTQEETRAQAEQRRERDQQALISVGWKSKLSGPVVKQRTLLWTHETLSPKMYLNMQTALAWTRHAARKVLSGK